MQLKKLNSVHFAAVLTVFGQLLQVKTQKEVASRLGINSASISDAKRRGAVPAGWLNTVSAETHISEAQIWERVHDVLAAAAETILAKPGEVERTTVSATQNGGVNNGTVAGIVQAAPVVPAAGDIANNLCQLIRDRMAGLDMDEQIELRAKVKRALEEDEPDLKSQPGEVQSEQRV